MQEICSYTVVKSHNFQYQTVVLHIIWGALNAVRFLVDLYSVCIVWNATFISKNTDVHLHRTRRWVWRYVLLDNDEATHHEVAMSSNKVFGIPLREGGSQGQIALRYVGGREIPGKRQAPSLKW